jgi:hypothetical protein
MTISRRTPKKLGEKMAPVPVAYNEPYFRYHGQKPVSTHLSYGMATVIFIIITALTPFFNTSTLM